MEAGHLTGRVKPTRGATNAPRGDAQEQYFKRNTHSSATSQNLKSFISFLFFCRHLADAHLQIESGKTCSDHSLNA